MPKKKKNKERAKSEPKKNSFGVAEDSETEESGEDQLKPARPKIGESADNLKQRSDWFQKRTGK
jgi:hypothetical protein